MCIIFWGWENLQSCAPVYFRDPTATGNPLTQPNPTPETQENTTSKFNSLVTLTSFRIRTSKISILVFAVNASQFITNKNY